MAWRGRGTRQVTVLPLGLSRRASRLHPTLQRLEADHPGCFRSAKTLPGEKKGAYRLQNSVQTDGHLGDDRFRTVT